MQKRGPAQHPHAAGVLPAQVQCAHGGGRNAARRRNNAIFRAGCSRCRAGSPAQRRPKISPYCASVCPAPGPAEAVQLGVEPLGADSAQRVARGQRCGSGGVQRKAELCAEPRARRMRTSSSAKRSAGVPTHRTTRAARSAAPAVQVDDSLAGGVGHGVDREIPPCQVGGQVVHKLYVIGVAVVAVAAVRR